MNQVINAQGPVETLYEPVGDDQPVPESGAVTLGLERWIELKPSLASRADPVGLRLPNDFDLTQVDASQRSLILASPLILLDFPKFADGRAYSQARSLRQAFGYLGEIRAQGEAVVADQLGAMKRCGIDSFVLRDDQESDLARQALNKASPVYQPAVVDPGPTVLSRRRQQALG